VSALGLAALLAGCGDSADPEAADPSAAAAASAAVGVNWNPCDGLSADEVSAIAGTRVRMNTGSLESPRCTFLPQQEGRLAFDISYLFFDGGLDEALDAMGEAGRQFDSVEVPGADSARIVTKARKSGVLVTGFVQTAGLVQSVNAVELKPYDEQAARAATVDLLGALAAAAPTASEQPSPSAR